MVQVGSANFTTPPIEGYGIKPGTDYKSSIIFFSHDFGETRWELFVLSMLVGVTTIIMEEAIPRLFSLVFKKILKVHLDYDPVLAMINLLIINLNCTLAEAGEILKKHTDISSSKIDKYLNQEDLSDIDKKRTSFYRTNFFELLDFVMRVTIVFLGSSVSLYLINYDIILWLTNNFLTSVVVIYGFMTPIQNAIAFVSSMFWEELKEGRVLELPSSEIVCILSMNCSRVKFGVLDKHALQEIVAGMEGNQEKKQQPILKGPSKKNASIGHHDSHQTMGAQLGNFLNMMTTPNDMESSTVDEAVNHKIGNDLSAVIIPMLTNTEGSEEKGTHRNRTSSNQSKARMTRRLMDLMVIPNQRLLQMEYKVKRE